MVGDVSIGTALDSQSRTNAASGNLAQDFAQFLTLLTVQLQNQDPLSPMDSTEFTNQLVAFAGVEQQINANQKLDALVALNLSNSMSSAIDYVGLDVSYISSEFNFDGSKPVDMKYAYSGESLPVSSKLRIYNEAGQIVYETEANKAAGQNSFTWNGRDKQGNLLAPGTYEVKIDALDANGEAVPATTVVTGKVRGVETQNGLIYLLIGDRAVALSNVINTVQQTGPSQGNTDALTAALSYVGLDIKFANTQINHKQNGSETVNYNLESRADRAKILIYDENGNLVFTQDVPKGKGAHSFTWNGKLNDGTDAPPGEYQFVIDAIDSNDQRIPATSTATGRVIGVETRNGTIYLNVEGFGLVALGSVLSADQPSATNPNPNPNPDPTPTPDPDPDPNPNPNPDPNPNPNPNPDPEPSAPPTNSLPAPTPRRPLPPEGPQLQPPGTEAPVDRPLPSPPSSFSIPASKKPVAPEGPVAQGPLPDGETTP